MALPKTATLAGADNVGPITRVLRFEMSDGAPLGFSGGQYIIVDSGITLPGGKVVKRAYSILSPDDEQAGFELAVRRLGPGSSYLHELALGAALTFSGPWGKFVPPSGEPAGATLIVATDTGITAALGLVNASSFRGWLAQTTLVWLVEPGSHFLPEPLVRQRLPAQCGQFRVEVLPPKAHPERALAPRAYLARQSSNRAPARAYLAGDGSLLYPMSDALCRSGLAEQAVAIECFFNNPAKKAA